MPVLKKKDFNSMKLVYESVDETLDELVDPDGSFIDSSVPVSYTHLTLPTID
jgi:hypothetical protein